MSDQITWTDSTRLLRDLKPQEDNPREIKKDQAERLVKSWHKFGQPDVIAIDPDGTILNGHQRFYVWGAAYGTDCEVAVRVASRKLSRREWQELTVMLHEGATGAWDWEGLANWEGVGVAELVDWGFDEATLLGAGFDFDDGNDEPPPLAQLDKADELQEKWRVSDGDVWQCGPHFIICGDCREPAAWARLLALAEVEKVNGVFTSPPYAEQRKKQYGGVPTAEYVDWWEAVQDNVRGNLAADGSFFVNIKPHCEDGERVLYVFDLVLAMRRRWGWRFVDELCWQRVTSPGRWPNRFKNLFEPVYHFSIGDCAFRPKNVLRDFKEDASGYASYNRETAKTNRPSGFDTVGSMKSPHFDGALPGNIIEASGSGGGGHWATFPVALPDFFIRAYSDPGDVWIDPFLGSATTICAAHQNDRRGIGIERLEKYVSVCLERLAGMGLEPIRVSNDH